ncbi:MAG: MafI family immunity protein [Tunicatimonas sp.]|uniref:MafI family immunity protein n=1 Tax=Tunicatimonas sp. TaxID=1940096 RepID=UPI003C7765BE
MVDIVNKTKQFGLHFSICQEAKEFVSYREHGVAFEFIVNHLYEQNSAIDKPFYELIKVTGNRMKLAEDKWNFLEELIR